MKLFDLFGRKSKEKPSEKTEEPSSAVAAKVYSGMRTEVMDTNGHLLFVAKLTNLWRDTAQLSPYSESALSAQSDPIRVQLRGYNDSERKAVYMQGLLTPKSESVWQIEELVVTKLTNEREFFRLDTNLDATITAFSEFQAGEKPCKLLDISVGGARIGSDQQYELGDKFMLKVKLLEDRPMSTIFCQVLRIIEKEEEKFEYGCKFVEMTTEDEESITRNIFAAQSQKRRGS